MPADRVHLVRHGEVFNPRGVLYGRLPNFALSERGQQMAQLAAEEVNSQQRPVKALFVSPLQRTRESAKPFEKTFGLTPLVDERLIEPFNVFEGMRVSLGQILIRPHLLFHFRKPSAPSWGEPYEQIVARMRAVVAEAFDSVASGDVVLVSHQLPIWMLHSSVAGIKLPHNPSKRRCSLSSITSFEMQNGKLVEVSYLEPAKKLLEHATDEGAV